RPAKLAGSPRDAGLEVLAALAAAGGGLPLRRLVGGGARAGGPPARLGAGGAGRGGGGGASRRPAPAGGGRAAAGRVRAAPARRACAKRALADKLAAAGDGLEVSSLSAGERTALRALVAAGVARVEHRPVLRAAEARAVAPPQGMTLTPAQAQAVDALTAALAGG